MRKSAETATFGAAKALRYLGKEDCEIPFLRIKCCDTEARSLIRQNGKVFVRSH